MTNPIDPVRPRRSTKRRTDEEAPQFEKPWMAPRLGEDQHQRMQRLAHTCYRCGNYNEDPTALAEHENTCGGPE
jgi:hypothetical protein